MGDTSAAQGDQLAMAQKNMMDVISSMENLNVEGNTEFEKRKTEGNNYFRDSKYAEAVEMYNEAEKLATSSAERGALFHNRGVAYERLQKNPEALAEYTKALQENPMYSKVGKRRARLLYVMEDYETALEDLTKVIVNEFIAEEVVRMDSMDMAEAIVEKLSEQMAVKFSITRGPKEPRKNAIRQYLMLFSLDPISQYWFGVKPLPDECSGDGLTGYLAALVALKSGEHAKVLDLCTEEINKVDSRYRTEALFLRGTYRFLWNYGNEVLEDFEAVVGDESVDKLLKSSALLKCAMYQFCRSLDATKMRDYLDRARAASKENTDISQYCAMHLLQSGYVTDALHLLQKSTEELAPQTPSIMFQVVQLGVEYFVNSQNKEVAQAILAKLLELEPSFRYPKCHEILGQCLLFAERQEDAQAQFEKAMAHDPQDPLYLVKRLVAQTTFLGGTWDEEAQKKLYEYRDMDPESEMIYHHIAEAESNAGHFDLALAAMQKSIDLSNNVQELKERISLKLGYEIQVKLEKIKESKRKTDFTPLE